MFPRLAILALPTVLKAVAKPAALLLGGMEYGMEFSPMSKPGKP
jgi:hypothetical protein